ncbi:MAG: hypothetical protein AAF436_17315 [Myxococcota bacterium]
MPEVRSRLSVVAVTALSVVLLVAPTALAEENQDPRPAAEEGTQPPAEERTQEERPAIETYAKPRRVTVGFNVDLFPIIASASQKAFGFSGQLQLAIDKVQFRLVGAKIRNFAALLDDDFEDHDTVVLAFIFDFFFREDLSGFWVASGFELWLNEIGNANTTSRADWTNAVWTLGGGYVWRIGPHFFINPWIGMHVRMNNPEIELGGQSFQPLWVVANGSVKLGAYFDL